MNAFQLRRAFDAAYGAAMEKVAGCCGGRGGMAMMIRHMGEKRKAKRRRRGGK